MPRPTSLLAAVALAVLSAAGATARELHWSSIEVDARLESDGRLTVSETQSMVFTGDWNGGERRFSRSFGQSVTLAGLYRVDPASGREVELREGDLEEVDEYRWFEGDLLRWRSRRPSDPPFDGTALVYRIELTYDGVLKDQGEGRYRLDHDFAFADRVGAIERFRLRLELAPEWEAEEPLPASVEGGPLAPGESWVVGRTLRFTGGTPPARATVPALPRAVRWGVLGFWALLLLERLIAWRLRDGALGRFAPAPAAATITPEWLERTVFSTPPEVVGAAWDRSIGGAEVAALIARLVQEGKLASRVEPRGRGLFSRQALHLERKVPLEQFDPEVRQLILGLFPVGATTDTETLRQYYRASGFDPVEKIKKSLERQVGGLAGFAAGRRRPSRWPTAILVLTGLALVVAAAVTHPGRGFVAVIFAVLTTLTSIPGWIGAGVGQSRIGTPAGPWLAIAISLSAAAAMLVGHAAIPGATLAGLAGVALLAAGYARSFVNLISTRESAEAVARRRELTAARRHFAAELRRPSPRLDDRWFPWLVAFGLAPQVDRWFRAHGGATSLATPIPTSAGGGGGWSSGGGSGWSGGGGAFGGAGASASFAGAVSTMAAGVAAPSSSGGSSGGGGGGSSGGGGGGGW